LTDWSLTDAAATLSTPVLLHEIDRLTDCHFTLSVVLPDRLGWLRFWHSTGPFAGQSHPKSYAKTSWKKLVPFRGPPAARLMPVRRRLAER
jgi:hypothetical protein